MNKIYKAKLAAAKNCYKCGGMVKKYRSGGMVSDEGKTVNSVGDYVKGFDIIGEETRLDTKPSKKLSDAERREMYKKTGDGIRKKYKAGGAVKKAFKPCKGCPTPAKCKKAGKCLAKK